MRNVTIVESNVEPNKEHLWFYNGKLKWFGPNGWEGVNKSSPIIPTVTTTTSSTPKPVTGSIRFTNKTNVFIQFNNIYYGTENATASPPIQPEQTCVLKYKDDTASVSEANLVSFDSLKITAISNGEIVQEYVPYEIRVYDVGRSSYIFSFKGLLDNEVTDVYIYDNYSSTTTSSTPPPSSSDKIAINARVDNGINYAIDISDFNTSASIPAKPVIYP